MPKPYDVFLMNLVLDKVRASLYVDEDDEFNLIAPNDRFTIVFFYTLGIPKADPNEPFAVLWLVNEEIVTGEDAPSSVSIEPTRPQHTKTVRGQEVDVGYDEVQMGTLKAIAPNVDISTLTTNLDIKGIISMYQPETL